MIKPLTQWTQWKDRSEMGSQSGNYYIFWQCPFRLKGDGYYLHEDGWKRYGAFYSMVEALDLLDKSSPPPLRTDLCNHT